MKNICKIIIILGLLTTTSLLTADNGWLTQGELTTNETGLVEIVLPAGLHNTEIDNSFRHRLDLSLFGPDGNSRAFELFWRSAGEYHNIELQPEKSELLDDKRLALEAALPAGYLFNGVVAEIDYDNYAGKVDVECRLDGIWQVLATGVAIQRYEDVASIRTQIPAAAYSAVRLTFSGYNQDFAKMPVFVSRVSVSAKRAGSDYARSELLPEFEVSTIERGAELRVMLPGSGLRLEGIEITTAAPFKGHWQIGYERIQLGRRDFQMVAQGQIDAIGGEPLKLAISHSDVWNNRVMLVALTSDEYFGRVDQVKLQVRLPRVVFAVDQPGTYHFRTGLGKPAVIFEKPGVADRLPEHYLELTNLTERSEWQSQNLLSNYNLKGGPFNPEGYTWNSVFTVGKPGFYQLVTNDIICLDRNRDAFRLVKDETQIPYFTGRSELRELAVKVEESYDNAANRSVYLVKLPKEASRLTALRFYARGIFERNLTFEKHLAGQVSWQPWQRRLWKNHNEGETALTLSLQDFPADQSEIRVNVEHASNQPLALYGFQGLYMAQDLFFIATEAGEFELLGGNPAARAPVYDLAIIQNKLLDMTPQKILAGPAIVLAVASTSSAALPVDQGAAFNNAGYTWVATFTADTPGFYQLDLNLQAALDNNKGGFRLVKNNVQIPYFAGASKKATVNVAFANEYDKPGNVTSCMITLPAASKNWQELRFTSAGVFSREPVLEIRKPGRLGWQTFKKTSWTSRTESESILEIPLSRLPEGETELRLMITHGDNRPIEISAVAASYMTHSLFFHAAEAGEYQLYGGNSKVRAPVYDLALIKDHMLKSEPKRIKLGETADYAGGLDIKRQFDEAFSETGWGLYAVLGVVTLLLIVIIVKLFPEDEKVAVSEAPAPDSTTDSSASAPESSTPAPESSQPTPSAAVEKPNPEAEPTDKAE